MTYNHFPVFCTKRLMLLSLLLMGLGINLSNAQEVIFYTPRTVHIVKAKGDQPEQSSLVVTAHPGKVKVRKSTTDGTTTYSTSALTVKVEVPKTWKNAKDGFVYVDVIPNGKPFEVKK